MSEDDNAGQSKPRDIEADVARRLKPGPTYDPVNLMAQIFEDSPSFIGPAEDVLLSWLMRLSPEVEQTWAASQVLESIVVDLSSDASEECIKLHELLRQASMNSDSKNTTKGRRGGRSTRVDV